MPATASLKVYPGAVITATDFAALTDSLAGDVSYIISGCAGSKINNTTIRIDSGYINLRGRLIYITGGDYVTPLATSGSTTMTGRIYCKCDLGNGSVEVLNQTPSTSPAPLTDDANFNLSNGVAYLILVTYDVSTTTITDVRTNSATRNFAVKNHASTTQVFGLGDTEKYGHTKVITQVSTQVTGAGNALAQQVGYALNRDLNDVRTRFGTRTLGFKANVGIKLDNSSGSISRGELITKLGIPAGKTLVWANVVIVEQSSASGILGLTTTLGHTPITATANDNTVAISVHAPSAESNATIQCNVLFMY